MKTIKRLVCTVLCLVLAAGLLLPLAPRAQAAGGKGQMSRSIAIVFDNSGSMYMGDSEQSKAWCRATYAMEVFAAMMNPGDTLGIYPMCPIEVRGREYTDHSPLVIDGADKVPMIRDILTPKAWGTPVESITAAYEGLKGQSGEEKWLIVLTDGAVFHSNDTEVGVSVVSDLLSQYNQDVNTLYLGIGRVAAEAQIQGPNQHESLKAANTADVLADLTHMCNMIFGRDELPHTDKDLEFDLPLKKLLVFVQGPDIDNVRLIGKSGSEESPVTQYAPHYSELGALNYTDRQEIDENLQGVLVSYENCTAGGYTVEFDGTADNISCYYEPDVELAVFLTDEDGNPVDVDDAHAGTYTLTYGLADKQGNILDSDLLGNTDFSVTYIINGQEQTVTGTEAGEVQMEMQAGDTLDVHLEATYLSGYHIERDGDELGWPVGGLQIKARPAGDLELTLSGGMKECRLSKLKDGEPFLVELFYEGTALTKELLDTADVQVTLEGGNLQCEKERTEEGFRLWLAAADPIADTQCGSYVLRVSATFVNEEQQTAVAPDKTCEFILENDGYQIEADLKASQKYYQISKIGEGKPLILTITKDGQTLSDEELEQLEVSVDAGNLPVIAAMLPGQSAYEIRLDPAGPYEEGKFPVSVRVTGTDPLGQKLAAEDSCKLEFGTQPGWMRWALPLLIILAILIILGVIISLLMNAKVLPKKISVDNGATTFTVNGDSVAGAVRCQYTGGGKKTGSLTISTPFYGADMLVNGGISMTLAAVSPRKEKSSRRRAGVVGASAMNGICVESFQVAVQSYEKDENGRFFLAGAERRPQANGVLYEISSRANCIIVGETPNGDSFTCVCTLLFQ